LIRKQANGKEITFISYRRDWHRVAILRNGSRDQNLGEPENALSQNVQISLSNQGGSSFFWPFFIFLQFLPIRLIKEAPFSRS